MNQCLYCEKIVNNLFCNASCQLRYAYKTGLRNGKKITAKAHDTLREKGHYKRDNSYLINNNPAKQLQSRLKISNAKKGEKNSMFNKNPWNKLSLTKKWWEEKEFRKQRQLCFKRDDNRCVNCGCETNLYCDHIVPYRICRNHDLNNLQTLCGSCHSRKTNKIDVPLLKAHPNCRSRVIYVQS